METDAEKVAGTFLEKRLVSLAFLSERWGVHRATARRYLSEAGIRPFLFGTAKNATIRYDIAEVDRFLKAAKS